MIRSALEMLKCSLYTCSPIVAVVTIPSPHHRHNRSNTPTTTSLIRRDSHGAPSPALFHRHSSHFSTIRSIQRESTLHCMSGLRASRVARAHWALFLPMVLRASTHIVCVRCVRVARTCVGLGVQHLPVQVARVHLCTCCVRDCLRVSTRTSMW